jgi:hypothetical protein
MSVSTSAPHATITIHGSPVPIIAPPPLDASLHLVLAFRPFQQWASTLDARFSVSSITLQSVDMFGPRVGFLKFVASATFAGSPVPGVIFLRGGAVAVLPVLRCAGERWVVCCRQPRLAVGRHYLEIPAGMLDGSGAFSGVACVAPPPSPPSPPPPLRPISARAYAFRTPATALPTVATTTRTPQGKGNEGGNGALYHGEGVD